MAVSIAVIVTTTRAPSAANRTSFAFAQVDDRFFRALYAKVLDSELLVSSKRAPAFLALVLKAVNSDVSKARKAAFVKRLLQVALQAPPNLACGIILVVSEMLKTSAALWTTVLDAENEMDETEVSFCKPVREHTHMHTQRVGWLNGAVLEIDHSSADV